MKRIILLIEYARIYTLLVLMLSLVLLYLCYSWILKAQHSFGWADFIDSNANNLFTIQESISSTNFLG